MIQFDIYGEPMAKQRPKVSIRGTYAHAYTPKDTILYENKVAHAYKEAAKDFMFDRNDLLQVYIVAKFPLSKGDYGKKGLNKSGREKMENVYCDKHKDLDNIIKIILDGLNGIAYLDDKQVVSIGATKVWTEESPKVSVILNKVNYWYLHSSTNVDIQPFRSRIRKAEWSNHYPDCGYSPRKHNFTLKTRALESCELWIAMVFA